MSEESSSGGLKNAIIGLITIIVTAIAGVIGKKMMGDDEATTPAPVSAPVIINLENNVSASGGSTTPAPTKATPKKDDWTKAEPKW